MAFTPLEVEKCEADLQSFMDRRRPPEDIRDELDLAYRIDGQSIVIFEIRPRWDEPEETVESPVAKTTYVRTKNHWRVFWRRADLKWHRYDPAPTVASLAWRRGAHSTTHLSFVRCLGQCFNCTSWVCA